MSGLLADYLADWEIKCSPLPLAFVTPGRGGAMLNYKVFLYGVKRICKMAGVPEVTPHELRHSFTELCIQFGGAKMEDIRRLLNHSSHLKSQGATFIVQMIVCTKLL